MLRNLVLDIGALLLGNIVAHLGNHRTAHFPVNLGREEINKLDSRQQDHQGQGWWEDSQVNLEIQD